MVTLNPVVWIPHMVLSAGGPQADCILHLKAQGGGYHRYQEAESAMQMSVTVKQ